MKRSILLTIIALLTISSYAQVWCPPGADWHWGLYGFAMGGHVHRQYMGDTFIGGRMAQRIEESGARIDYLTHDTTLFDDNQYTAVDNGDVLVWVAYGGVWQWDTL